MAELAQKIVEIQLLQHNMKRMKENAERRDPESFTYSYLTSRCGMLREYLYRATRIHAEIIVSVSSDDQKTMPYFTEGVFGKLENEFEAVDAFLSNQLDTVTLNLSTIAESHTSTPERNRTVLFPSYNPHAHVKLPSINLPKFSGDIQGWPEFINLFDSSIHVNATIQPSLKLTYLVSCLTGEAKSLVSSVRLINENYEIVRTTLKSRYENNRVLLSTLLKQLTSLDKVHSDSLTEL